MPVTANLDTSESPPTVGLTPLDGETLGDAAYRELRRRILSVDLRPDTAFSESQIAESLGLSKSPIREALLRLRLEGLVEVQSRSGYVVTPVTLNDARDVCRLRAVLEAEAATHAARGDQLAVSQLRTLDSVRPSAAEPPELASWIDIEYEFHVAIARIAGNQRLVEALARNLTDFVRLAHLCAVIDPAGGVQRHDHGDLIAAIEISDGTEARELAVAEVHEVHSALLETLISSDSIASANVEPAPSTTRFYLDIPRRARHTGGGK